MTALLGVARSALGRRWTGPDDAVWRAAAALVQATGQPEPVARVLARLGVPAHEVPGFLAPTLRQALPDPARLQDAEAAADRLLQAVRNAERIAIFADYDVDGAASSALLIDWLRGHGRTATLYVPDRIDEGYGPNPPAMRRLAADHDLIVLVDCGTLGHDAIAAADGADVLVLDHHLAGETLPAALAVVNPNRADEDGTLGHLCAASVVFLVLVAANRQARAAGLATPDLLAMLDLVALATVADVAPLIGVNRALVRQGLAVMARRERPGLTALADVARLDTAPAAWHLGFLLGPRINAGGRIGQADLGARLLATADPAEAAALAERLDALNTERREIEAGVLAQAMDQAQARGFDAPLVWAAGAGWHPGVVGIVAARLKEAANRPAMVIGLDGAEGKGSGRSVAGVDLGGAVQRLVAEDLLIKGGGHRMAAGLTVAADRLEPAMARLTELLARQGAGQGGPRDLAIDAVLMPAAATLDLIAALDAAGPFGAGAAAPRFAFPDLRVVFARRAGESHLRLTLRGDDGGRLDAIAFRAFEGPLGPLLEAHAGARFHFAGRLEADHWGGRAKPKLRIEDAAPA
ncbi:MAG TPA: single-stranded-DNA-specific exonuclease RecJ [Rhodobacteraceae bacterium]|nr:single-stranded-DNA-specific exonuclease RecJ [Paracoccaceae bacterium]HBG98383.1 single-stranded-DNA-specific exonuclease RecJ [Paracoccaceae bacterium]